MRLRRLFLLVLLALSPAVAAAKVVISSDELSHAIGDRITRVPEFKFIREEAERLGVHAYLFGGTAAGYAHYVNWDLQREHGDKTLQPDRFDYDYTNAYRSTQDLDIVVDGSPEKAKELQERLTAIFPHLQGNKTAWEVRLLRQSMGDKQALLHNADFLNQHTDSNSTGLIEITKPHDNDPVVRDLRDWNSRDPFFLKDVHEGKLHYYFSPLHETTAFYKEGRNPPIISVIRYLTKAFQFELEMRPEDLVQIQKVIDEFNPHGPEMQNGYVRNWLLNKNNGRKLIQAAVNMEYASNTLEKLGLRKKLMQLDDPEKEDSLGWWMNKEPLKSHPLGQGTGKTAAELGLDVVAHETNSFLAYESITKAHTGDPNVFVSRPGVAGETAALGKGFYTREGRHGARGTGITIRFHLNPKAREGTDFEKVDDYIVIKNRNALQVIQESLNIGPMEYLRLLAHGKDFDNSDLGILEKLRRRVSRLAQQPLSPEDEAEAVSLMHDSISKSTFNSALFEQWFSMPVSIKHPEVFDHIAAQPKSYYSRNLILSALSQPHLGPVTSRDLAIVQRLMDQLDGSDHGAPLAVVNLFASPRWTGQTTLAKRFLAKFPGYAGAFARSVLSRPGWTDLELVTTVIKRSGSESLSLLRQPQWAGHPELLEMALDHIPGDEIKIPPAFIEIFKEPHWVNQVGPVKKLLTKWRYWSGDFVKNVLAQQPEWTNPEVVKIVLRNGAWGGGAQQEILSLMENPRWAKVPGATTILEELVKMYPTRYTEKFRHLFSRPYWAHHPDLIALCEGKEVTFENVLAAFKKGSTLEPRLKIQNWYKNPSLLHERVLEGRDDQFIASIVLPTKPKGYVEIAKELIHKEGQGIDFGALFGMTDSIRDYPQLYWDHPEVIEQMIREKNSPEVAKLFSETNWKNHPYFTRLTKGRPVTYDSLFKILRPKPTAFQKCAQKFQGLFGR